MTHVPLSTLRNATEETVTEALDSCYVCDTLEGIAPVVLLEFFQRMVDQLAGEED